MADIGTKNNNKLQRKQIAQRIRKVKEDISMVSRLPASQEKSWLLWYKHHLIYYKKKYRIDRYLQSGFLPAFVVKKLKNMKQSYKETLKIWLINGLICNTKLCKDGKLFIRDITLPAPANDKHIVDFSKMIRDSLFTYLFEEHLSTDEILSLCAYGEGPYEYGNVRIEKGGIVIDAGSCIGDFAALASVRGASKVYAFEPIPGNVEQYLSKTAQYNKNIEICQYALSDYTGELSITDTGILTGESVKTGKNTADNEGAVVKSVSLDDFVKNNSIQHIDFIKADIEGAEREMLKGAKNILAEFAPKLAICTYHLPDDPQVLRELILDANPRYVIEERFKKMYAYVPE